jgi:hypothetical protein
MRGRPRRVPRRPNSYDSVGWWTRGNSASKLTEIDNAPPPQEETRAAALEEGERATCAAPSSGD